MKTMRTLVISAGFLLIMTTQVWAEIDHVPAMFNFVVDVEHSAPEDEVQHAYQVIAGFADLLHRRAYIHPGERADWVAVRWSVTNYRYNGTRFVNCSNRQDMAALVDILQTRADSKNTYTTSTYQAISQARNQLSKHRRKLPGHAYIESIILITDGKGTNAAAQTRHMVKQLFPDDDMQLFIVTLGDQANVDDLQEIANGVVGIEEFDNLLLNLLRLLETIPEMEKWLQQHTA